MTATKNKAAPQRPAIVFRKMNLDDAEHLAHIDRSERIEQTCRVENGQEIWTEAGHECPTWDVRQLEELQLRFRSELEQGGAAVGAYDGDRLVGFGLLAHRLLGPQRDTLPIDLMYVSRSYRRRGIGTRLMQLLSREALLRGAKALYISSTESNSAVRFYRSLGSENAAEPDADMLAKEPLDIHMVRPI
ncbi:GNAT family N-acetyltransferase [Saccharibacillus sacchari]|uniref:GNAT family N-acetyltransferase n=1 Tax=Saccharibacillus sacchari TaxID=456493 RepID=A0ACC6PAF5_9BACL